MALAAVAAAFAVSTLIAGPARAKELSYLFIGDSFTFMPGQGSPNDPALPRMIQKLAHSIDRRIQIHYAFRTQPGWGYERHFNDPATIKWLSRHYEEVILQGYSIEPLELTPWMVEHGNYDVKSFAIYLPKVLDLAFKSNSNVTLFVNWGWGQKNEYLQEGQPGLYFTSGPRAGQKWCGQNKFEFQKMIDDSYVLHAKGYPVTFSWVGDEWLALQGAGLVTEDDLYLDDFRHPSVTGAFVTALVIVRDTLHLDVTKNGYFPSGLNVTRAKAIENFVSQY